jgi:hypothetical protein
VNGFFACSSDGDGEPAMVALDLDQNPDTGSAYYGTEVAFAPAGPSGTRVLSAPTGGTSAARATSSPSAAAAAPAAAATRSTQLSSG